MLHSRQCKPAATGWRKENKALSTDPPLYCRRYLLHNTPTREAYYPPWGNGGTQGLVQVRIYLIIAARLTCCLTVNPSSVDSTINSVSPSLIISDKKDPKIPEISMISSLFLWIVHVMWCWKAHSCSDKWKGTFRISALIIMATREKRYLVISEIYSCCSSAL